MTIPDHTHIKTTYKNPDLHVYLDSAASDVHQEAIVDHLLDYFDVSAGDRVVEIGAGSGRYTDLLLRRGLKVLAVEPDVVLARKMMLRFGHEAGLAVHVGSAYADDLYPDDVRLVCGFHVLHHIDREGLGILGSLFDRLGRSRQRFAGWFFLEPNPLNLLYPIQIALSPAMSFAEENGIWRQGVGRALGRGLDVVLGTIGRLPPRPFVGGLPRFLQTSATSLAKRPSFSRLYRAYGRRVDGRGPTGR